MNGKDFIIRVMSRKEVAIAIEWAAIEGWNPGLFDAECFYTADPEGFLIGLLDNEPVAVISAIKYPDNFGFIGFYIVKPEYRGLGYGFRIWNTAMARMAGRTVGLDGVIDQQTNYMKSGFQFSHRNVRYQGTTGGKAVEHRGIVPLSCLPFSSVLNFDRNYFPGNRSAFLKCWIHQPQSKGIGFMQDRKLSGYGVIRACRSGFKIGPLFADNPEAAEILFRSLSLYPPESSSVFLDIPATNELAVDLVSRYGMRPSFETARMYAGSAPVLPLHRIYGITSFELG